MEWARRRSVLAAQISGRASNSSALREIFRRNTIPINSAPMNLCIFANWRGANLISPRTYAAARGGFLPLDRILQFSGGKHHACRPARRRRRSRSIRCALLGSRQRILGLWRRFHAQRIRAGIPALRRVGPALWHAGCFADRFGAQCGRLELDPRFSARIAGKRPAAIAFGLGPVVALLFLESQPR